MLVNGRIMQVLYGFNRYMVECESKNNQKETNARERFNRYMVECE